MKILAIIGAGLGVLILTSASNLEEYEYRDKLLADCIERGNFSNAMCQLLAREKAKAKFQ
jgi:hypothetical protein